MSRYARQIEAIAEKGQLRKLTDTEAGKKYIVKDGMPMLNLSSNDYLGLASDTALRQAFFDSTPVEGLQLTAASSRLLTGNHPSYRRLEELLAELYGKPAAMVFNSGYHANSGILPAVADSKTLILADKLVHASLIEGILLSKATTIRYRHNDYSHLEKLLQDKARQYETIIIVTESIFSMDGDTCDLDRLASLKKEFPNVLLYVDEAHAVGVRGENGLGLCEERHCIDSIDFLIVTFGKALASVGAAALCSEEMKTWLVNTVRPFIFTTALPPINVEWTYFVLSHLHEMQARRNHLKSIATRVCRALNPLNGAYRSESHIVPYIVGSAAQAQEEAARMQREGFYLLPVRPPTVPQGTSRLRISLNATCSEEEATRLIETLTQTKEA